MKRGSQYSWREGRPSGERQELDYSTEGIEHICAMGVEEVAAADAHLFLWTTGALLEQSFEVVRRWGFRYSQTLVWCKEPHGWGPGGVFQATAEFVLYARRGQPWPSNASTIARQWWAWPRGEHSAKPEAFYDMLDAHFPMPRLELFARRGRLGWEYAGNQALATVEVRGVDNGWVPEEAAA